MHVSARSVGDGLATRFWIISHVKDGISSVINRRKLIDKIHEGTCFKPSEGQSASGFNLDISL